MLYGGLGYVVFLILRGIVKIVRSIYADELALVIETPEGLKGRLEAWKGALKPKGLSEC